MAKPNEILSALSNMGFGSTGPYYFGSWKGYAVTLRRTNNRTFFADLAVRPAQITPDLRKALAAAVKDWKIKVNGAQAVTKDKATCCFTVSGKDDAAARLAECLDAMTAALWNLGLAPANTCAISGVPQPDSLCMVPRGNQYSYQPVSAAAIRQLDAETREKVEENQTNGSVLQGALGALIGAVAGLIPNMLTIVFTERIYAALFALVPILAMVGYKLFKGKMGKVSIVVVIVLSLLSVALIPLLEIAIMMVREYGYSFGRALGFAGDILVKPGFLGEIGGDLAKLLLFMGLGILFAWSYMSKQTNSGTLKNLAAMEATMRPNPAVRTQDDEIRRT